MVKNFAEKFFITPQDKQSSLCNSKSSLSFFGSYLKLIGLPGEIDCYYLAKSEDNSFIRVVMKNEISNPDDESEDFQTYEVEFGDYSVNVMPPDVYVEGGFNDEASDDVLYFRNKKYQELMQQKAVEHHCAGDYKTGCNRFNGMKYHEKASDNLENQNVKINSLI